MTPEEFRQLLDQDRYLALEIPPEDFAKLEKEIVHRAYTYCPATGHLTIKISTRIYASVLDWAARLIEAGVAARAFGRDALVLLSKSRETGFGNGYEGVIKALDTAIVPGRRYRPTVVFEFGYTEKYLKLVEDVKILLEGSQGEIKKAIIISVAPLGQGETEISEGFVEGWRFVGGVAKRDGERENLFPPPRSHATQRLTLTLGEILGDEFSNFASNGWAEDSEINLYLDPLRNAINRVA